MYSYGMCYGMHYYIFIELLLTKYTIHLVKQKQFEDYKFHHIIQQFILMI